MTSDGLGWGDIPPSWWAIIVVIAAVGLIVVGTILGMIDAR